MPFCGHDLTISKSIIKYCKNFVNSKRTLQNRGVKPSCSYIRQVPTEPLEDATSILHGPAYLENYLAALQSSYQHLSTRICSYVDPGLHSYSTIAVIKTFLYNVLRPCKPVL